MTTGASHLEGLRQVAGLGNSYVTDGDKILESYVWLFRCGGILT
jgi:hypothetical protein